MEIEDNLPDKQQPQANVEKNAQPSLSTEQEQQPDSDDVIQPDPLEEQAEPDAENAQAVLPVEHEPAAVLEPVSVVQQARRRSPRWVQVIAAVLVVACLLGGVLVYASTRHNAPATSTHGKQASTPTPIPPLAINNWCAVNGPTVDAKAGPLRLSKVVALSANDAWALGSTGLASVFKGSDGSSLGVATRDNVTKEIVTPASQSLPVLTHWDGGKWSTVPTADATALINSLKAKAKIQGDAQVTVSLNDLAALSSKDIWVVGEISASDVLVFTPGAPVNLNNLKAANHTLIEHWDGSSWQIVDSPDLPEKGGNGLSIFGGQDQGLASVAAVSARDIWAVGSQAHTAFQNGEFSTDVPLAEHWDGTSWRVAQLPAALQKGGLDNVQAISSSDIWAFGTATTTHFAFTSGPGTTSSPAAPDNTTTSLAAHWDGQQWSVVNLPQTLSKGKLDSEAVISANNIWVVGKVTTQGVPVAGASFVQHWDGSQWSSVDGPEQLSSGSSFTSIYAISAQNIWLLGQTKEGKPLIEHWNGKTWSLVSPKPSSPGLALSMAISGNRAWVLVSKFVDIPPGGAKPSPVATSLTYAPLLTMGTTLETNC